MKKILGLILGWVLLSGTCWATWSGCETITGVTNYITTSNQLIVTVSPAVACSGPGIPSAFTFTVGQYGFTQTNINSTLGMLMGAQLSSKQVMISYDANCVANVVSVGGYAGQCN